MRAIYLWAMRNGSQILFALSAMLFLIGFGQALLSLSNAFEEVVVAGETVGQAATQLLLFVTGTFTAFSSAVLPFVGALIIDRWDRRGGPFQRDSRPEDAR